jgi:hypothetical protein
MPLDNSLNQDIHEAARDHASKSIPLRQFTNPDDPRLFSLSTPTLTAKTYIKLTHPVTGVTPVSNRICQDIHKWPYAVTEIRKAKGVYVPGLAGNRTGGKRNTASTVRNKNHGGARTRKEYNPALTDDKTHPDLLELVKEHGDNLLSVPSLFANLPLEDDDSEGEEDDDDSDDEEAE